MAAVSGATTTFNLENFVGELFHITPKDTKFLSLIGGINGGAEANATVFTWQDDDNDAPTQPAIVQNADPTYEERSRTERSNVVQIFQYGIKLGYTQMAARGQVGASASPVLGTQPVQSELARQTQLKLWKCGRDVNLSFLQGTYANPATNATGRKTRGMKNVITTNTVAAAGARLNRSMLQELWREMAASGAPFRDVMLFCNIFNKQLITDIYGYVPESREVGGLSIKQIMTDIGEVGVVYDRDVPTDEVYAIEMSVCRPRFLPIPGKGHLFLEKLAQTGAAENWQLYGEMGLEYGPELWHGSVTGTATS